MYTYIYNTRIYRLNFSKNIFTEKVPRDLAVRKDV